MQVPQGTKEAQDSIRKAKDIIIRLKKGGAMLDNAFKNDQISESRKIIHQWLNLSKQLFTELEMIMILQQSAMLGKNIAINSSGRLVDIEHVTDKEHMELDPWTLLTLEKLHYIFGDDLQELIEIKNENPL